MKSNHRKSNRSKSMLITQLISIDIGQFACNALSSHWESVLHSQILWTMMSIKWFLGYLEKLLHPWNFSWIKLWKTLDTKRYFVKLRVILNVLKLFCTQNGANDAISIKHMHTHCVPIFLVSHLLILPMNYWFSFLTVILLLKCLCHKTFYCVSGKKIKNCNLSYFTDFWSRASLLR